MNNDHFGVYDGMGAQTDRVSGWIPEGEGGNQESKRDGDREGEGGGERKRKMRKEGWKT